MHEEKLFLYVVRVVSSALAVGAGTGGDYLNSADGKHDCSKQYAVV